MSWNELIAIRDEAKEALRSDRSSALIDCPLCGATLERNSRGWANCPLGHFRTQAKTNGELNGGVA